MPYLWRRLRWVRYGDIEPVSRNDIFKYIKLDGVRMHHEIPRTVDDVIFSQNKLKPRFVRFMTMLECSHSLETSH
jgi:hypothetical protein